MVAGESAFNVHYELYDGGHKVKAWKDELPKALRWLFWGVS
jgi:enterochelin esterase-like enzyme